MNTQHTHIFDEPEHIEDYSVLNFLLENVRGISPSSLTPQLLYAEGEETE